MDYSGLPGYQEARKILWAHTSARARDLQRFDDYVRGKQYARLKNWWSDAPIWKRAPCIVDPIVSTAIRSNVDLVLGEGRYPAITSRPDEDEPEEGLGSKGQSPEGQDPKEKVKRPESPSERLDKWLEVLQHTARFSAHCRQALEQAQGTGTAVGIFGVRSGRPFADLVKPQWCTRKLNEDGKVTELVIQYPYLSAEEDGQGKQVVRCRRYRRQIDASRDVTFKPIVLTKSGPLDEQHEDPTLTKSHQLGFCPAVWYRFMAGCSTIAEIDGHPVHEDLTDEVDALNYALSQSQHAAIYAGQPQPYEVGVEPGFNPTGTRHIVDQAGSRDGETGVPSCTYDEPHTKEGRIKGPGNVWQYPSGVTVGYLTIPEGALEAMDEHCQRVRSKITEGLAVVLLDPDQVKFAATVSGKAMEALRARQLDRCDQIRDDFGDGYLLPAIDMLIRVVRAVSRSGQQVDVPGIDEILPLLDDFAGAV